MKIISADWLVICDENNSIIQNGAVVFTDKIQEVDTLNNIEKKYPDIVERHLSEPKEVRNEC